MTTPLEGLTTWITGEDNDIGLADTLERVQSFCLWS
jgi:hypothetical protein